MTVKSYNQQYAETYLKSAMKLLNAQYEASQNAATHREADGHLAMVAVYAAQVINYAKEAKSQ